MKNIFIAVFTLFSSVGFAQGEVTRVILQYDMGNQITRTGFTVLSNGTIMRQEALMGRATYLEDQKLSQQEVKALISKIDQAASTDILRNDDISATEGGSYGELKAFTSDGSLTYIYVLMGGNNPMKKTMVCQAGDAAEALRTFVQGRVRDQMPLKEAPCK